jgi:hypothetical protein
VKPTIALFDLDSTLSDSQARYERFEREAGGRENIDWTAYALAAGEDPPTQALALARLLRGLGLLIGGVSFRPEEARAVSVSWAANQGIDFEVLALLPDRNKAVFEYQVEYKVKEVSRIMETYEVVLFVEDRYDIAKAVQDELSVPSLVVASYPPRVADPKNF